MVAGNRKMIFYFVWSQIRITGYVAENHIFMLTPTHLVMEFDKIIEKVSTLDYNNHIEFKQMNLRRFCKRDCKISMNNRRGFYIACILIIYRRETL